MQSQQECPESTGLTLVSLSPSQDIGTCFYVSPSFVCTSYHVVSTLKADDVSSVVFLRKGVEQEVKCKLVFPTQAIRQDTESFGKMGGLDVAILEVLDEKWRCFAGEWIPLWDYDAGPPKARREWLLDEIDNNLHEEAFLLTPVVESVRGGQAEIQFLETSEYGGRLCGAFSWLLFHSCFAVKGFSGSPVVDAEGRLLAVHRAEGPSSLEGKPKRPVFFNIAVRADLLAREAFNVGQDPLDASWEATLEELSERSKSDARGEVFLLALRLALLDCVLCFVGPHVARTLCVFFSASAVRGDRGHASVAELSRAFQL